jgi:hypothetical protein
MDQLPLAERRCNPDLPTRIEAARADARYVKSERRWLPWLYPTPANLFEVNEPHFHLRVNPVLNLAYGSQANSEDPFFYNQRGLQLRGGVDDRLYLHFELLETQAALPNYVNRYISQKLALPGNGLYKDYKSDVFNIARGYDFLNSQGYLGFNLTPHVGMQLGYGRHFIGNGLRSMLLSDFSNNYFYLKLNWQVWKLHYQNIFAELAALSDRAVPGDVILPKKYMAAHHLSIDLTPNLNVGIFETVIFSRVDHFELQYLNPIIFYRTVEQAIGSPDNVLLGIDGHWNLLHRFQLYGQLMLDEFVFREMFLEPQGWWANKWALQAGLKYIDAFGLDHLDLQAELNLVRPFTYSHRGDNTENYSVTSYTHYGMPLAHPLEANFREVILRARYQPLPRLTFDGTLFLMSVGENPDGMNVGAAILRPHQTRTMNYGNELLQGVRGEIWLANAALSYELRHNLFLEGRLIMREKQSDDDTRDLSTTIFSLGIRWNAAPVSWGF